MKINQAAVWKISHYHEISVSSKNLEYFSYSLGVICMSYENYLIAQRIILLDCPNRSQGKMHLWPVNATYMLQRGASYPLLICSNL